MHAESSDEYPGARALAGARVAWWHANAPLRSRRAAFDRARCVPASTQIDLDVKPFSRPARSVPIMPQPLGEQSTRRTAARQRPAAQPGRAMPELRDHHFDRDRAAQRRRDARRKARRNGAPVNAPVADPVPGRARYDGRAMEDGTRRMDAHGTSSGAPCPHRHANEAACDIPLPGATSGLLADGMRQRRVASLLTTLTSASTSSHVL